MKDEVKLKPTTIATGLRSSFILHPSSFNCNWSMKRLLKLIVMSGTYRQSGQMTPTAQKADPQSWEAIYNAIITEAAMKRFDAARADLARLRKLKPDAPSLDQLEAAVSRLEKDPEASPAP